jgi:hypothetical protein
MRMRHVLVAVFAVSVLASPAAAEKRVFIIANPDGYGVDRCLAGGESCGSAVAAAYCRAHDFTTAVSFRRVERAEVTASAGTAPACRGAACDELVAIECTR